MSESWTTNEIASAYERSFRLLEDARKEFAQAAYNFMVDLRREIESALHARNRDIDVICTTDGTGFESVISVGLSVPSGSLEPSAASGLQIKIKVAAVSGGKPGHIRIAAIAWLDARQTSETTSKLRLELRDVGLPAGLEAVSPAAEEILAFELSVEKDGKARTTAAVVELIQMLAPMALRIVEHHQFTELMRSILIGCEADLRETSPSSGGLMQSLRGGTGWWQGMHFIQFEQSGLPGFWVGYRVEDQTFLYGHTRKDELIPSLAVSFYDQIGARPPRTLGGNPAGLLWTAEELRAKASEEIGAKVVDSFRKFYELIRCEIRDDQTRSCQASQ